MTDTTKTAPGAAIEAALGKLATAILGNEKRARLYHCPLECYPERRCAGCPVSTARAELARLLAEREADKAALEAADKLARWVENAAEARAGEREVATRFAVDCAIDAVSAYRAARGSGR